jgi:hypothetical protein
VVLEFFVTDDDGTTVYGALAARRIGGQFRIENVLLDEEFEE